MGISSRVGGGTGAGGEPSADWVLVACDGQAPAPMLRCPPQGKGAPAQVPGGGVFEGRFNNEEVVRFVRPLLHPPADDLVQAACAVCGRAQPRSDPFQPTGRVVDSRQHCNPLLPLSQRLVFWPSGVPRVLGKLHPNSQSSISPALFYGREIFSHRLKVVRTTKGGFKLQA